MRQRHAPTDPNAKINWAVIKMLWPYMLEFKRRVGLAVLCLMLAKVASVVLPFVLKHLVDAMDRSAQPLVETLALPLGLVLAYGLVRFSNVLFGEFRDTLFGRVTERVIRRIGLRVFEHLHRLDLDFHLNRRTGGLSRDIERGTSGINFLLRFMVFNIVPIVLELLMVVGVLFYNYGWPFAVITLLSVTTYVAYSVVATEWRTRYVREANAADSTTNTRAVDSLLNYETVKYFGNEQFEADRYDSSLAAWEQAKRKNRLSLFTLNVGQALIIAIAMTSMMGLAAWQVTQQAMTLGDFVLINAFMMQLFMPLNFLGFVYREMKGSLANIDEMFGLLTKQPKVVEVEQAATLNITDGAVSFNDVSFHYHPDRPILKGISFSVAPGQKVAVVGESGAGKSTLMKLLFRFYDANSGEICIDEQPIAKVSLASLRAAIGIVPQDTVLFNDSILENIRYGRPDASDEEVAEAIKLAHLSTFIAQLPQGWDTTVGERGLKLSGGEKQRVAIARTILKRPPILVFDEATSSLDSQSEQAILAAMANVTKGHTSLVIAHRLSTIQDADKIIVLQQGEVAEQGTHQQLLAANGIYSRMWQIQQQEE
ncbi:ABCB family ABC transporter ATP-binding protein/permease [Corallincola spongiicola]|uniref:ABC transporter ATP-binding protein/permease n=1 Tax=Corallincola spongiicola TaxID=2520508 RepID=A0ABY1WRV2_9GAMM|nr:ABC transporter ATP-binding protein/permease [Corallincola spongiicola]TAA47466.1 ABC transporter ATP-binding protein/permease [Corallincola spongiicola]